MLRNDRIQKEAFLNRSCAQTPFDESMLLRHMLQNPFQQPARPCLRRPREPLCAQKSAYDGRKASSVSGTRLRLSTQQGPIFAATHQDASIFAAQFVAALGRCHASTRAPLLLDQQKSAASRP
jgi:hypothetical protein